MINNPTYVTTPFIQSGAGAVQRAPNSKMGEIVTPQDFGAKGDGVTDDTAAFQAMAATGRQVCIPFTANGYVLSATITFNADYECYGFFIPTTAIGGAANKQDRCVFIVADSGYAIKRRIKGIKVAGSVALRAAGVYGIRNDCPNSILIDCSVSQLDYGYVARSYSQTYLKCNAWQNNTNVSAYARDNTHEINCLVFDGGNYDSAVNVAFNLGDTSWPDAMAAGNFHGVDVCIINGVNTDGAESRADNIIGLHVERTYSETTNTDTLWRLGGSGDGNLRQVRMIGNFWKTASYAVKCLSAIWNISVRENSLSAISASELYLSSDLYPVDYSPGAQVGSFANGQPVRLAFRSLPIANITFSNFTLGHENLRAGIQDCLSTPAKWYPGGCVRNSGNRTINTSSSATVFYTTPATGISGTVAGSVFTFTNFADAKSFNGGDRIATVPAGATYVRSVDYVAGTMVIDGGVTAAGAATVSQQTATTANVA